MNQQQRWMAISIGRNITVNSADGRHGWRWRRVCCWVSGALLLAGCSGLQTRSAPQVPLGPSLKGQGVAYSGADAKFKFSSMNSLGPGTVAALAGGVVGAFIVGTAMEYAEGEQVVKKTGLTDPAIEISRRLGERVNQTFGSTTVGEFTKVELARLGNLTANAPAGARYLLDLRTDDWGGSYLGSQAFTRVDYQTKFRLRATLIDVKSGVGLARGECNYGGRLNATRPTYDELMENAGARLHDDMAAYAKACVQELWDQIFAVHERALKPVASDLALTVVPPPGPSSTKMSHPASSSLLGKLAPAAQVQPTGLSAQPVLDPGGSRPPSSPDLVQSNPMLAERYRLYALHANPKAFAIADNGGWWMAWGESPNPGHKESVTQRALRGCVERNKAPCVLYAVDDLVVHGQER